MSAVQPLQYPTQLSHSAVQYTTIVCRVIKSLVKQRINVPMLTNSYSNGSDSLHHSMNDPVLCYWLHPVDTKTGYLHCPMGIRYVFLLTCPFSQGGLGQHLIHGSLSPCESTSQVDNLQFTVFAGVTVVTSTKTDHTTLSI